MADEDYEHWPEEEKEQPLSRRTAPGAGHDSHNGLHTYVYRPAGIHDREPAVHRPVFVQLQQAYYQPQLHHTPYALYPGVAYPAPAYYGLPQPVAIQPTTGAVIYLPAVEAPRKEEKRSASRRWQGRSRREVEEDNMRIAAREGAYDARKVQPIGLAEDQVVWCVEVDGSQMLRTYASVKELQGEWKQDPRFKDSWYFVRDEGRKKTGRK